MAHQAAIDMSDGCDKAERREATLPDDSSVNAHGRPARPSTEILTEISVEADFANPRAPEHISAPRFAVPKKSSFAGIQRQSLVTMTPRSVLSSQRAFSSVV